MRGIDQCHVFKTQYVIVLFTCTSQISVPSVFLAPIDFVAIQLAHNMGRFIILPLVVLLALLVVMSICICGILRLLRDALHY